MKMKNLFLLSLMLLFCNALHAMNASKLLRATYYDLLGVSRTASESVLKKAYYQQARRLHPDVSTGDKQKFQDLQRAYETLKDSNLRNRYDQTIKSQQTQSAQNTAYQRAYQSKTENAKTENTGYHKTYESNSGSNYKGSRTYGEYTGSAGKKEGMYERYKDFYNKANKNIEKNLGAYSFGAATAVAALAGHGLYRDYQENLKEYYKTFSRYEKMSEEEKISNSKHNVKLVEETRKCHACYLENADLQDMDLSGSDFSEAFLPRAQFVKANLNDANFEKADLRDTDFKQATLKNAIFKMVKIWGNVDFSGADLDKADFTSLGFWYRPKDFKKGQRLPYVINFSDAKLTSANFTDASFHAIQTPRFVRADLSNANFTRANLWDADFTGADLTNADFTDAKIEYVNFTGATLKGTKLDTSKLDYVTWLSYKYQNLWNRCC